MKSKLVGATSVPIDLVGQGFSTKDNPAKDESFDLARIDEAIPLINLYLDSVPRIRQTNGSYTLKHLIERKMKGGYLSNGELIVAMIALRFRFRRDDINCFFNVCPKSIKYMRQESDERRRGQSR